MCILFRTLVNEIQNNNNANTKLPNILTCLVWIWLRDHIMTMLIMYSSTQYKKMSFAVIRCKIYIDRL